MSDLRRSGWGRVLGLALAAICLAAPSGTALAQEATPAAEPPGGARRFDLPGEAVFPEGVAFDARTGNFYVGSTVDGTIFRGNVQPGESGVVDVFSPGGADGRTSATGLAVDGQGRLFAAGGQLGQVWVYDTTSGALVAQFDNGLGPNTFLNGVAVTPAGDAFVTDSFNPVLFRVPAAAVSAGVTASPVVGASPVAATPAAVAVGDLEFFLDLSGTVVPFGEGFNLNGIVAGLNGGALLTVHTVTGGLFRVDLASQEVTEVDLGGATLENGDGMALVEGALYVVRNADGVIVPIQMADDLTSGTVGEAFSDPSFAFPTTIAPYDGCLLVVNSQFDQQQGGQPQLPFTVVGVPAPAPAGGTPTAASC